MTYKIPTSTLVNYDILVKCWRHWVEQNVNLTPTAKRYVRDRDVHILHRTGRVGREVWAFRDWLWTQGGTPVLLNKQQYISFTDPEKATMFLLRWS